MDYTNPSTCQWIEENDLIIAMGSLFDFMGNFISKQEGKGKHKLLS